MNGKAAIIIVNWNGLKFLKDCLSSIFSQSYKNFDLYFVDNNSIDDSIKFVKENFAQTKIIALNSNTGFAKGNNEGMKVAFKDSDVEYIVCVNNDTIVDREWLKELIVRVNYSKKVDMVGSLSLLPSGEVYSIGANFNRNLNNLSIGYGENVSKYQEVRDIFSPHGVSALYTRRLIEDVGMFDEDFFCYCEEFDLGLRARNKGYKAIFTPYSKLIHYVSSSSGGMANPFKAFHNKRNSYFVAIKNFNTVDLFLFPFRDMAWNLKSFFSQNKNSVKIMHEKVKIKGLIIIMLRVIFNVIILTPKMLVKRYKEKKY